MTPMQARMLAHTLTQAAAEAEAKNSAEIELQSHLQRLDDKARSELDAAIKAAQKSEADR